MLNKVILIGNLGGDPESRVTNNGKAMTTFSVATTERYKDKDGQKREDTEWHNVTTFGRLAEICAQYLAKGSQVYLEGKIQTRKYEKDGQTRYSTSILASEMQMLGGKPKGEREAKPAESRAASADFDDTSDIPF